MKKIVCCLTILCLLGAGFWRSPIVADLTLNGLSISDHQGEEDIFYKESHALVIGIRHYTYWPNLPGANDDVQEVKVALEAHGFNVVVAMDLERNALEQTFNTFINQYGHHPDNRLVFYFAGHGYTRQLEYGDDMGYIVPADAPLPATDESGFLAKAIDMRMIDVYARRIESKHALFLFDSCFSGSIFTLPRTTRPETISYKMAHPVRQFITSGSAEETVPDVSIFRHQFIAALEGEGDVNNDGYVTGAELGLFLADTVINYTSGAQHPQYGKILHPTLDKGDIVFDVPVITAVEVPPGTEPTPPIDLEVAMWELVKGSNNPSEVKKFLAAFPDGRLADLARSRLKQLEPQLMTPTPTPTATPVPMPTISDVGQQIAQLLEQGEAHFERQRYTTPEDSNAFAVYRDVLKLDPNNELALQRIQQMLDFYQSQAARAEQQGNRQKALQYYQRYLTIAPNDEAIWDKVAELEAPPTPVPATPRPTATPARTPTPRSTATPPPVLAPVTDQEWRDPSTGMEFVWIPGGCFQMGSPANEEGRDDDEGPVHRVCLDGFWMGKYEVTQAEWQTVMGNEPAYFNRSNRGKDSGRYPVEQVSWGDVQEFIQQLNSRSSVTFRLPSEAEWEYACRAGSQATYSFGNDSSRLGEYAWYTTNSRGTTHPVGQLKPNAFGLYDMHGNVWEWCEDPWHKNYQGAPTDGSIWSEDGNVNLRVLRGGSWVDRPQFLRCAYRDWRRRVNKYNFRGVRLVRAAGG